MNKTLRGWGLLATGTAVAVSISIAGHAADQSIDLSVTADPYCGYASIASFTNTDNVAVDSNAGTTSAVHIQDPVDSSGYMQDANFTYQIISTCNAPSKFLLRTQNGGLTNSTPVPASGGWLNRIDYSATLNLPGDGGATSTLITNGTPGAMSPLKQNNIAAYSGALQVGFQVWQNISAPLVAGDYSDVLTIAVNPQ